MLSLIGAASFVWLAFCVLTKSEFLPVSMFVFLGCGLLVCARDLLLWMTEGARAPVPAQGVVQTPAMLLVELDDGSTLSDVRALVDRIRVMDGVEHASITAGA